MEARRRQSQRLDDIEGARARTNAELSGTLLDRVASPDPEGLALLRQAADTLSLSARGFHRTLADLEASPTVARHHVAEALSYRAERLGSERQAA